MNDDNKKLPVLKELPQDDYLNVYIGETAFQFLKNSNYGGYKPVMRMGVECIEGIFNTKEGEQKLRLIADPQWR